MRWRQQQRLVATPQRRQQWCQPSPSLSLNTALGPTLANGMNILASPVETVSLYPTVTVGKFPFRATWFPPSTKGEKV
jgi:hypothetical protein